MRRPIEITVLIAVTLFACSCKAVDTTYLESCNTDEDCGDALICEPVLSPEYALNPDEDLTSDEYLEKHRNGDDPEEEYVYPACTLTCEVDADCPESDTCEGTDWCISGVCSASNCA